MPAHGRVELVTGIAKIHYRARGALPREPRAHALPVACVATDEASECRDWHTGLRWPRAALQLAARATSTQRALGAG